MPRFDETKPVKNIFKKNEVRSWDDNLLESLQIPSDTDNPDEKIKKQNKDKLGDGKGSVGVRLGFNKAQGEIDQGSVRVPKAVKTIRCDLQDNASIINNLIQRLSGNEQKIFFYVVHVCSKKGSFSTGEVLGAKINSLIESTKNSRETAIKRLVRKGLLKREIGKTGIHGTLNLSISELIKNEALSFASDQESQAKFFA